MTLKTWLVGLGLAALVGVAGCRPATTSYYRAGYCPTSVGYSPAPTTVFAPAAAAPCCNGQPAVVTPVPPIRY